MKNHFKGFTVEYIKQSKNTEVDELVKATTRNTPLLADVFLQVISDASIKIVEPEPKMINLIEGKDWHEHTRMQQRVGSY
jgi:hypothetical protein